MNNFMRILAWLLFGMLIGIVFANISKADSLSIYDSKSDNSLVEIEYINNNGIVSVLLLKKEMLEARLDDIEIWIAQRR